jgi:hypothetical protein
VHELVSKESLKRMFAVYVVIAKEACDTKLYVGKTGDNNDGCNPLISRCGNHFSYNKMHSQVRNKLDDHEERDYTYVFDRFDDYPKEEDKRRVCIDKINELERWLNQSIQKLVDGKKNVVLLNPFSAAAHINKAERGKRMAFRTSAIGEKIEAIAKAVGASI